MTIDDKVKLIKLGKLEYFNILLSFSLSTFSISVIYGSDTHHLDLIIVGVSDRS